MGKIDVCTTDRRGLRILGNTIGNLVAGEIAQSAQERAMRRAGVERSASSFEKRFGDTAEVAAYREAGLAAARHPGSREARANFDQAARILLEANSGDSEVAAFLNHINPDVGTIQLGDIAVTGSRDYLLGSTIDNAGIWVGEKGNAIKQGVGQFIQDNPGIGIALTLADGAFAVVAPVKYLGGMALDYFKDEATGFIADKMTGPKMWSVEKGQAGGSGIVLAGGIALGGLGALKGVGGSKAYTHNYGYADRVQQRALEDPSSHNFPYSYDDEILRSAPIPKRNGYTIYQSPGSMRGKPGVFEIGVTKNGVIDHRFFRPDK